MTQIEILLAQLAAAIQLEQGKAVESDAQDSIPVNNAKPKNLKGQVQNSLVNQIVLDHMRKRRML